MQQTGVSSSPVGTPFKVFLCGSPSLALMQRCEAPTAAGQLAGLYGGWGDKNALGFSRVFDSLIRIVLICSLA